MKYINVDNSQRNARHWLSPIRSTAFAVGLAASVAFTPSAQAGAIFDAITEFDLTLTYSAGVNVNMEADLFNDVFGSGTGFSTSSISRNGTLIDEVTEADTSEDLGLDSFTSTALNSDDTISFSAQTTGTAGGFIFGDSVNTINFFADNTGAGDATVSLELDLTLDAAAAIAFQDEFANADGFFELFGLGIDLSDLVAENASVLVENFGPDELITDNDVITLSTTLNATILAGVTNYNFASIIADTSGEADGSGFVPDPRPGAVPEPETLVLFGLGLLGMGFLRRKQKLEA